VQISLIGNFTLDQPPVVCGHFLNAPPKAACDAVAIYVLLSSQSKQFSAARPKDFAHPTALNAGAVGRAVWQLQFLFSLSVPLLALSVTFCL
jgi:hypothetical protein